MTMGMMRRAVVLAAGLLIGGVAVGGIAPVRVDTNSLAAFAGGPFGGVTHTGTISITSTVLSTLNGVVIFGTSQPFTAGLSMFQASINLTNGAVQGGSIAMVMTDGSGYQASITAGVGQVNQQVGQGFRVDGLTFGGTFTNLVGGNLFAGVDVLSAAGSPLYPGSFLLSAFQPDPNGNDAFVNFETYVLPSPGAAALFAATAMSLGLYRRR